MTPKNQNIGLILQLAVATSILLSVPTRADSGADAQEKVSTIARQLEQEPTIPPISAETSRIVYEDSTGYAVSIQPSTSDSLTTTGGVVQNIGVLVTTSPNAEDIESLIFQYKVRIPVKEVFPEERLAIVASTFARKYYPKFWTLPGETKVSNYRSTGKDAQVFTWQKLYNGLNIGNINISVRLWDEKIVDAAGSADTGVISRLNQAKFTPEQAKAMLLSHTQKYANQDDKFSEIEFSSFTLLPFGKPAKLSYLARIQGVDRSSRKVVRTIDVLDAMTGKFFTDQVAFSESRELPRFGESVSDTLPIWNKRGASFVSQRQMEGPDWAKFGPQLVTKFSESLAYLTYDLGASPSFVSTIPNSFWVAMERQEWAFAVDTATGNYRVLGTPERSAVTPTISPDGSWAIVSASSPMGNADYDLFADHIVARGPELQLRARLVLPGSDEHHPLYSPDGKWIYFVSTKRDKKNVVHSLRRISAVVAQTEKLTQLKSEQIEIVVANLPADVQRISVFPDGKQLILQTGREIFSVEIEQKKVTSIKLPPLKDVEVGGAFIQQIGDAWAGPGNDEVTFSGKTVDADKKERRRIYSCRFDGSNLKALTPAENTPVPAYKFPESQKTAYELAKEMALGEIAWDEKHKDN